MVSLVGVMIPCVLTMKHTVNHGLDLLVEAALAVLTWTYHLVIQCADQLPQL